MVKPHWSSVGRKFGGLIVWHTLEKRFGWCCPAPHYQKIEHCIGCRAVGYRLSIYALESGKRWCSHNYSLSLTVAGRGRGRGRGSDVQGGTFSGFGFHVNKILISKKRLCAKTFHKLGLYNILYPYLTESFGGCPRPALHRSPLHIILVLTTPIGFRKK